MWPGVRDQADVALILVACVSITLLGCSNHWHCDVVLARGWVFVTLFVSTRGSHYLRVWPYLPLLAGYSMYKCRNRGAVVAGTLPALAPDGAPDGAPLQPRYSGVLLMTAASMPSLGCALRQGVPH